MLEDYVSFLVSKGAHEEADQLSRFVVELLCTRRVLPRSVLLVHLEWSEGQSVEAAPCPPILVAEQIDHLNSSVLLLCTFVLCAQVVVMPVFLCVVCS